MSMCQIERERVCVCVIKREREQKSVWTNDFFLVDCASLLKSSHFLPQMTIVIYTLND